LASSDGPLVAVAAAAAERSANGTMVATLVGLQRSVPAQNAPVLPCTRRRAPRRVALCPKEATNRLPLVVVVVAAFAHDDDLLPLIRHNPRRQYILATGMG